MSVGVVNNSTPFFQVRASFGFVALPFNLTRCEHAKQGLRGMIGI